MFLDGNRVLDNYFIVNQSTELKWYAICAWRHGRREAVRLPSIPIIQLTYG
jgi:hypothetical protein